jgi:hypothetical protein
VPSSSIEIEAPALPRGVTLAAAAAWPDTAEASRQLGVSPRTVLRLGNAGRLRCYLIAGRRRYDPADLAAGVEVLPTGVRQKAAPRQRTSGASRAVLERAFGRK